VYAHLEITSGIIRLFRDDAEFGHDPFEMSLCLTGDEGVATLKGLCTAHITLVHAEAIRRCLADYHFTDAIWTRHEGDTTRHLRVHIDRVCKRGRMQHRGTTDAHQSKSRTTTDGDRLELVDATY
jgi:hypothetical protein